MHLSLMIASQRMKYLMKRITKVIHPDAFGIRQSWVDEANITGRVYTEKPFWYMDNETRQNYHDIFGCIGWPTEFSDKSEGAAGYAGVVGIVKSTDPTAKVQDAKFKLLYEIESHDVPTLIDGMVALREEYGFGVHPGLMQTFFGDPNRFITVLALKNERLEQQKVNTAILIAPPNDFYTEKIFDKYVRALRSVLVKDKVRFYFGKNDILRTRMGEFKQGDPAIYAIGGLVHTLLSQCMWMDYARENIFVVEDDIDRFI